MPDKTELIRFLDLHVFDPILAAAPSLFCADDRRKLGKAQHRARSEKERFHRYSNAREIIDNYKSDLRAPTVRRVDRELEALHLPTLSSVCDDFLTIAESGD